MSNIYKMLNGRHINLDEVIPISEVKIMNIQGWGQNGVNAFAISCRLMDHEIIVHNGWDINKELQGWHIDVIDKWKNKA